MIGRLSKIGLIVSVLLLFCSCCSTVPPKVAVSYSVMHENLDKYMPVLEKYLKEDVKNKQAEGAGIDVVLGLQGDIIAVGTMRALSKDIMKWVEANTDKEEYEKMKKDLEKESDPKSK